MVESLLLKEADVAVLAEKIADVLANRLEPVISNRHPRLVDRPTMAKLANIGTATLDRLVAAKAIPSVLVGKRRLFSPDRVIEKLCSQGGAIDE